MDLIGALRVFIRVVETGSFSAVAQERGSTQSAVSHQMTMLEEFLGARLLQRSTRNIALTDDGRDVLAHAYEVLRTAEATIEAVGHRRAAAVGHVRLAVSVVLGIILSPRLGTLLADNPELSIELVTGDGTHDLVEEGIDVWVRSGESDHASLVSRRVGTTNSVLVAAPDYLAMHPAPVLPADLSAHECLIYHRYGPDRIWQLHGPGGAMEIPVRGRFSANNGESVRQAALAGLGIALLPEAMLRGDLAAGRLIRVLADWSPPGLPITIVYPSRRGLPVRTRVVIDFLVREIRVIARGSIAG